jgi:hypothetical protein
LKKVAVPCLVDDRSAVGDDSRVLSGDSGSTVRGRDVTLFGDTRINLDLETDDLNHRWIPTIQKAREDQILHSQKGSFRTAMTAPFGVLPRKCLSLHLFTERIFQLEYRNRLRKDEYLNRRDLVFVLSLSLLSVMSVFESLIVTQILFDNRDTQ